MELALRLFWIFEYLWCLWVGGDSPSLMEVASNHLGDSYHKLGGGVFEPTRFVLELSWQPFFLAKEGTCKANGYNESRSYLGAKEGALVIDKSTRERSTQRQAHALHLWLLICQPELYLNMSIILHYHQKWMIFFIVLLLAYVW